MQYINSIYNSISNTFNNFLKLSFHDIFYLIKNKSYVFFNLKSFSKQTLIKNAIDESKKKNINKYNQYDKYISSSSKKFRYNNFNNNSNNKCNCVNNCNLKCNCDWGWFIMIDV